jgi:hypothetical protein
MNILLLSYSNPPYLVVPEHQRYLHGSCGDSKETIGPGEESQTGRDKAITLGRAPAYCAELLRVDC